MFTLDRADSYEITTSRPLNLHVRGFEDIPLDGWFSRRERVLAPLGDLKPFRLDPQRYAVCREFAGLASENDYLKFAERYGPLGIDQAALRQTGLAGEPLEIWREHVYRVAWILNAWDCVTNKTPERLSLYVPLGKPETVRTVATKIQHRINENLRRLLGPRIALASDAARFTFDYEAMNLLGLIWLQCAWVITGKLDYRTCRRPRCRQWLALGMEGDTSQRKGRKRAHAEFCSPHCRASSRQELLAAIRNRTSSNQTLKAIAAEWSVPIPYVKRLSRTGQRSKNRFARR
jgi:hypothetical protein